ncbi:MAG: hypothetical protein COV47_04530 [Candidatus Diapherotrites archaeon CG11_big_fil_rev_8_21_14_0_20_37_9]|nr:MAG: hypothetical protein COV47_04530 [Candidatus Diapherotrites archaeon CG11_big_fil_rev_8_21_14_0_20_37_9]
MSSEKIIVLEKVSKKFDIGFKKKQSALGKLLSMVSGREQKKTIWPIQEITFSVKKGEFIGLIGKNGSGKSTLLRIIAEIYQKNKGNLRVTGKVVSLINLQQGFRYRLTMKDNIYLYCTLFGMESNEISITIDSILDFSGLQDFLDTKVYQFSNGMLQRLALAIGIYSNPDVLLLDEVFESSDEEFTFAARKKLRELSAKGITIILASHDFRIISEDASRGILLDSGKIIFDGSPAKAINAYRKLPHSK